MKKYIIRTFLFFFVMAAFFGPFVAIMAIENNKRDAKKLSASTEASDAAEARYQYYQDINKNKTDLKKAMEDAKAEYEQLLKNQPGLIDDKKNTTTKTTVKPVTTQKVVQQKVTTAKPKASTKTKSS
jgi:predicted transcriptional regulator